MISTIFVGLATAVVAAMVWSAYGPLLALGFAAWSSAMFVVGLYHGTTIMVGGLHRRARPHLEGDPDA